MASGAEPSPVAAAAGVTPAWDLRHDGGSVRRHRRPSSQHAGHPATTPAAGAAASADAVLHPRRPPDMPRTAELVVPHSTGSALAAEAPPHTAMGQGLSAGLCRERTSSGACDELAEGAGDRHWQRGPKRRTVDVPGAVSPWLARRPEASNDAGGRGRAFPPSAAPLPGPTLARPGNVRCVRSRRPPPAQQVTVVRLVLDVFGRARSAAPRQRRCAPARGGRPCGGLSRVCSPGLFRGWPTSGPAQGDCHRAARCPLCSGGRSPESGAQD